MPTKRLRRTRNQRPTVSEQMRRYFLTGRRQGCGLEAFTRTEIEMRRQWGVIRAEVVATWAAAHPGTRPWAWWHFTAPEPRQRLGGVGRTFGEAYGDGVEGSVSL